MRTPLLLLSCLVIWLGTSAQSFLEFGAQNAVWTNYQVGGSFQAGGRSVPQLSIGDSFNNELVDAEIALNIAGYQHVNPGKLPHGEFVAKPYRLWTRYSNQQLEIRLGLQKINFGSADLLRPLMWFDHLDPRDPLQQTDGVWAALGRYYFLNNANIWLWLIYPENKRRTWELLPSDQTFPEWGGRVQHPLGNGEVAMSFHRRNVNQTAIKTPGDESVFAEHRFGIDGKWDWLLGCWFEATITQSAISVDSYRNQRMLNIGTDYTFGLGNGLHVTVEQLFVSFAPEIFASTIENSTFSALSISYPKSLFDQLNLIIYYDWTSSQAYTFASWKHQFKHIDMHLLAWVNPEVYRIPTQEQAGLNFGGKGIQLMIVYNFSKRNNKNQND